MFQNGGGHPRELSLVGRSFEAFLFWRPFFVAGVVVACVITATPAALAEAAAQDVPDLAARSSASRVYGTTNLRTSSRWVTYSHDGKHIITTSGGALEFWDVETGKLADRLEGETAELAVAVSPDGKRLACGGEAGKLVVWDLEARREVFVNAGEVRGERIVSIAFSPDGKRLAVSWSRDGIEVCDAETGDLIKLLPEGDTDRPRYDPTPVAFSPDGRFLVFTQRGAAHVYDARSFEFMRVIDVHSIYDFAGLEFVSNEEFLTCANRWGPTENGVRTRFAEFKVWNANTGELVREIPLTETLRSPMSMAVSQDRAKVALFSLRSVHVLDVATGAVLARNDSLPSMSVRLNAVAIAPNGKRVAVVGVGRVIWHYDAETGGRLHAENGGHDEALHSMSVSPDGARLASSGGDGKVIIWDAKTAEQLATLDCGRDADVRRSAWSADGRRVFAVVHRPKEPPGFEGAAFAFDSRTGVKLFETQVPIRTDACAVSTNGRLLAVAAFDHDGLMEGRPPEAFVELINAQTGQSLKRLTAEEPFWPGPMRFSDDGVRLYTISAIHSNLLAWDVESGEIKLDQPIGRVRSVHFAAEHPTFVSSVEGEGEIRELETGREIKRIRVQDQWLSSIAISRDGRLIASSILPAKIINGQRRQAAAQRYSIRIWDGDSGDLRYVIPGVESGSVLASFEFSPDNKTLYAAMSQGVILAWDLEDFAVEQ